VTRVVFESPDSVERALPLCFACFTLQDTFEVANQSRRAVHTQSMVVFADAKLVRKPSASLFQRVNHSGIFMHCCLQMLVLHRSFFLPADRRLAPRASIALRLGEARIDRPELVAKRQLLLAPLELSLRNPVGAAPHLLCTLRSLVPALAEPLGAAVLRGHDLPVRAGRTSACLPMLADARRVYAFLAAVHLPASETGVPWWSNRACTAG